MRDTENKVRLIRRAEVMERVGLSKSSIYKRMTAQQFPKPVSIGGGRVAWVESDINNWIDQRLVEAGRNAV